MICYNNLFVDSGNKLVPYYGLNFLIYCFEFFFPTVQVATSQMCIQNKLMMNSDELNWKQKELFPYSYLKVFGLETNTLHFIYQTIFFLQKPSSASSATLLYEKVNLSRLF